MNRRSFIMSSICALAAKPALAQHPVFFDIGGTALGGYDTVSFHTQAGPRRGRRDIAVMWRGTVWYFSDSVHRDYFEANPWLFAPQYGGYCAYSMSQGRLKGGDPRIWRVEAGRLYVIADHAARLLWLHDPHAHIAMADKNWPGILMRG